jgi:hypothetical protein
MGPARDHTTHKEGHPLDVAVSTYAAAKVVALVMGIVAGADSISDMDELRHGGMTRMFASVRAPSTLGSGVQQTGRAAIA